MDPGKSSNSQSPGRGMFDAANLISPFSTATTSSSFVPLSSIPSAFSMFGRHPVFPPPFGGLGVLSPGIGPGIGPMTGGADWWRAASEHARRLATTAELEYYSGALSSPLSPHFGTLSTSSTANSTMNGIFSAPLFQPYVNTTTSTTSVMTSPSSASSPVMSPAKSSLSSSSSSSSSSSASKSMVTTATAQTPTTSVLTTSSSSTSNAISTSSFGKGRKKSTGGLPMTSQTPVIMTIPKPKPALTPPKLNAEEVTKKMNLPSAYEEVALNLSKSDNKRRLSSSTDNLKSPSKKRHDSEEDTSHKKLIAEKLQQKMRKQALALGNIAKSPSTPHTKPSCGRRKQSSTSPITTTSATATSPADSPGARHTITTNLLGGGKFPTSPLFSNPSPFLVGDKSPTSPGLSPPGLGMWGRRLSSSSGGSTSTEQATFAATAAEKEELSFAKLAASSEKSSITMTTTTTDATASMATSATATSTSKPKQLQGGMTAEKMGRLFPGLMGLKQPALPSDAPLVISTGPTTPTATSAIAGTKTSLTLSSPRSPLSPGLSMGKVIGGPTTDKPKGRGRKSSSDDPKVGAPKGRGRGKSTKSQKGALVEDDDTVEQKRKQELLKAKLEAELKQQQLQLRLQRKAQAMKEKEIAMKSPGQQARSQDKLQQQRQKLLQEQQRLQQQLDEQQQHLQQQREQSQQQQQTEQKVQKKKRQRKMKEQKAAAASTISKPQESKLAQVLLSSALINAPAGQENGEKLVAKFKTIGKKKTKSETQQSSEESSAKGESDSGSDDSSSGSDSDNKSGGDSSAQDSDDLPLKGLKRQAEEGETATPRKRHRVTDERALFIPMEEGWKRHTHVRTLGPRGILGEVIYLAPCGKRLKTYPDITRYLARNNITHLTKDHFTFSTKFNIGVYYRQNLTGKPMESQEMPEDEVHSLYTTIESRRAKRMSGPQRRLQMKKIKQLTKKAMEMKQKRQAEQQEMAQRLEDITKKRKAEKQNLKEAANKAKQFRDEERRKQKEQMKLLKQQEKLQRQEQLRMEREMRAQHVVEARKRRKEELQSQRFAETLRKAKERERRRQHMMLVKALENRRKLEEKERLKEEKKAEKRLTKQRKLEQKRLEIQMAKEMKKPVEDMQLMDAKPLPTLNRIPGVKLPGPAFADCLMVVEFLHNFGNALGLDKDSIPSLNTIQMGMLNDEDELEEVLSLMTHLLKFALDDPGVPNPKEATTLLNEKITDVDLNENNISEVLRIFLVARNGSQDELTEQLKFRPYQAFNSTQKASLLGALCNELLCSKVITNEIERSIDTVSNLRRDKWVVEGKIRKMKHLQSKKFGKTSPSTSRAENTNGDSTMFNESSIFTMDNEDSSSVVPSGRSSKRGSDDEHEDGEDESGNESEGPDGEGQADGEAEHEEEEQVSQEELEKKVEKLTKQQGQYRNKVFDAAQKLRAMAFGQDRYKRRYWVLPYCGGIFVEGKESSELPTDEEKDTLKTDDQKCSLSVTENLEGNKVAENSDVKKEKGSTCKSPKIKTEMSTLPINGAVNIPDQKTQSEDKSSTNLFLQEPSTTKFSDLIQPKSEENSLKVATGSVDSKGNSSMTSPTSTPAKPGFMSIDSILKKDFVSSPSLLSSSCFTTTLSSTVNSTIDMVMKNHSVEPINQSWFSIIPRVPCDDSSIVHSPGTPKTKTSLETSHSSSFGSHSAFSPFQKLNSTPTFAGFQMGQIGNQQGYAYPGLPVFGSSPIPHSGPNSKPDTQGTSHGAIETVAGLKEVPAEALKQHSEPKPIPKELERGWWRITDPNQLKQVMRCLHMRGIRERALQKTVQKYNDYACTACSKGSKEATELEITDQDKKISQTEAGAPDPDPRDLWLPETALDLEISVLEDVESLEERIFNASLQVKGWKLPPKATEEEEVKLVSRTTIIKKDDEFYPLELAKERLVNLENNIERRYLKPPFIKSPELDMTKLTKPGNESPSSSDDSDTDDTTPALLLWRRAVTSATNPSQLMMCVLQLNKAIAWEKSIMKVSCQICHLDDNEAELLLCDSCDKGFHTYCFKPKMENIPDGDWYCYECISKASGHPHCLVCGRKNGKMAECDKCDKAYHIDCLNPPLPRLPRKYTCISCLMNKTKCKGKRGRKSKQEKELEILTEAAKAAGEKRSKEENALDLTPCGIMLEELEDHEDGWPFLKPVNTRQFPQYRKVIKQPMDFATMRAKLEDNDYKTRQEFASDVRIIFDNCRTFNEDDSDVGQAGHNMRKYFEVRWKELCKIHS